MKTFDGFVGHSPFFSCDRSTRVQHRWWACVFHSLPLLTQPDAEPRSPCSNFEKRTRCQSQHGDPALIQIYLATSCPAVLSPLLLSLLQETVHIWLRTIGLWKEYEEDFKKAGYKGKDDVENLKRITEKELRETLRITKFGKSSPNPWVAGVKVFIFNEERK